MPNKSLKQRPAWKALEAHQKQMADIHMRDLFAQDPQRFDKFHCELDGILFDYSKHLITDETVELLFALAQERDLQKWRDNMFFGAAINNSENRAALHIALRGSVEKDLKIDGENVTDFVNETLEKIKIISEKIRQARFTDVVSLGIGGSDLGPHMVCEALRHFADGPRLHFVSNIDGAHISQTLVGLDPKNTLFIIASKTFGTLETLSNAQTAKEWLGKNEAADHFVAVTANKAAAKKFGITDDNILPLREWIGGRYSLWSGIGLSIAVSTGFDNFEKLLEGAHVADKHFLSTSLEKNIPVIMALLGIWYRNFRGYGAQAVIPYAQNLRRLPAYIQQLDMESNGKSIDRDGKPVDYPTSPVVFGEPGTDAQHAFFQLLHQGTDIIPCDFIVALGPDYGLPQQHTQLLANALAQSQALMEGNGHGKKAAYQSFDGNRPSSTLLLQRLDPYHLGMLLALYEHKIFVQGAIWNLNSFDQWGVELGKELAKNIAESLESRKMPGNADSSTRGLMDYIARSKS